MKKSYVVLDARGLVLSSLLAGKDPDGILDDNGTLINSVGWCFDRLLSKYSWLSEVPPSKIVAVWDSGNDYRTMLFPAYKAGRKEKQEKESEETKKSVEAAISSFKAFLDCLGATQVSLRGVEADDIIAYLCQKISDNFVVTIDKDLTQLNGVNGTKVMYDGSLVESPVGGIPTSLICLHKSVVGDPSDGYPGVPGIGKVSFQGLLEAYGEDGLLELEEIVKDTDWRRLKEVEKACADKTVSKLYEHRETWNLMYQLSSLHPELCEGVRAKKIIKLEWRKRVPSKDALIELGESIGRTSLVDTFGRWTPKKKLVTMDDFSALDDFYRWQEDRDSENQVVAFDYESYDPVKHPAFTEVSTRGNDFVDVLSQVVTGASFAYGENWENVFYVPCRHKDTANLSPEAVGAAVESAFAMNLVVAQNAYFEATVTKTNFPSVEVKTLYDTLLMASHVDENDELGLKHLSKKWLRYDQTTYEEVLDGRPDMTHLSGEEVLDYGCDDSLVTGLLFDLFYLILQLEGTIDFVLDTECEFVHEQSDAFIGGVTPGLDVIARLEKDAEEKVAESMATLREVLAANCVEPNAKAAEKFFNQEIEPFIEAAMKANGASESAIAAKLDAEWEKTYLGSKYVPFQVVTLPGKPHPMTKTILSRVAAHFGFPPIEKISRAYLTEWMSEVRQTVESHPFLDALAAAAHQLKDREGEEYLELVRVCTEVLGSTDKVVQEGDELNIGSSIQMQRLLYCKLGLPVRIRSKVDRGSARDRLGMDGSASTDALAVSAALANDVEPGDWRYVALNAYAKIKKYSTQLSLFLRPLPKWVHPRDGKIHPYINNCGTVTRRPSGTSPNFLQLTKKDGGDLRGFVKPYDYE